MESKWNFGDKNYGPRNGANKTEYDRLKGTDNLAREHVQNSLDAADNNKKVRLKFELLNVATKNILGYEELKTEVTKCYDYAKKSNDNGSSEMTMKRILDHLNSQSIKCLKISDYNTTGLSDVFNYEKGGFVSLTKGNGTSEKDGKTGGSKGVGKYTAFAASSMRTVFYSTYNKAGEEGFIGVTNLISRKYSDEDEAVTLGYGYYSNEGNKCRPINGQFYFNEKDKRKEYDFGTDIYILGFDNENWKDEVLKSVLESFMVAIYKEQIEIYIENTIVNKDTLENIVKRYNASSDAHERNIVNQFELLTDDKVITEEIEFVEDKTTYKFTIKFKKTKNDNSKICLLIREPYMFIQKMQLNYSCACMAIVDDENLCKLLKKSEDSCHKEWSSENVIDAREKTIFNKVIKTMKNKIKEFVEKQFYSDSEDIEIEGASEYIADEVEDDNNENEQDDKTLQNSISINIKNKKTKNVKDNNKASEKIDKNDIEDMKQQINVLEDEMGNLSMNGTTDLHYGQKRKKIKVHDKREISNYEETDDGDHSQQEGENVGAKDKDKDNGQTKNNIKVDIILFVLTDANNGLFKLILKTSDNDNGCKISINQLDESGDAEQIDVLDCSSEVSDEVVTQNGSIVIPSNINGNVVIMGSLDIYEQFSYSITIR